MYKTWLIKDVDRSLVEELARKLNIPPVLAHLFLNRDISDEKQASDFLNSGLGSLHDPFLMKGMDRAVSRIRQAVQDKEKILIFGDYDVDGVFSSVLLRNLLTGLGAEVVNYIPHRMTHGYGLNEYVCTIIQEQKIDLVITIDCGVTAIDEVKAINQMGVEVIVFDHHEPGEDLPEAFVIVNPKQRDCPYPFKELASVGLVAKLSHALLGRVDEDILDLVAIGTVTDIVPLLGENRIFVKEGLPRVQSTKNLGLSVLLDVAKIKGKKVSPYHIGFIIGPRINAAGRMDSAHSSLDLLLSQDQDEAYRLARSLEAYNTNRQKIQRDTVQEALALVEKEVNFKDHRVIVLSKEGWHKGVLGIVASQITERYYRPTIVISVQDGVGTASARSIEGFHLYDALSQCSSFLEGFGGHEGAAGLTIRQENIDRFKDSINQFAKDSLDVQKLMPSITVEGEIALKDVTLGLAETLSKFEPFGEGNPEPTFCTRKVIVKSAPAIMGKETIKFWVTDTERTISAVGFGMAKYREMVIPGKSVDLAYQISIDDWNKAPTVQLRLKDIRKSPEEG